jgi:hypothetical protein
MHTEQAALEEQSLVVAAQVCALWAQALKASKVRQWVFSSTEHSGMRHGQV